jgi:phosphoribosylformylglycinamidine (FGAM) synthase PurS component
MRIEVHHKKGVRDSLGESVRSSAMEDLGITLESVMTADAYEIQGVTSMEAEKISCLLADPIVQTAFVNPSHNGLRVEISYLDGVTDNIAEAAQQTVRHALGKNVKIKASKIYFIKGAESSIKKLCEELLYNKLIQECRVSR